MRKILLKFTFILALISTSVIFADEIYEGQLEIIYIDSKTSPQKLFRLRRSDGSTLKLNVGSNFKYEPGTLLRIKAKEENNTLSSIDVLSSNAKFSLIGNQSDARGNKKLLVIAVTDSSFSESFIPYSKTELEQIYFGSSNSVIDYIDEASASRLQLTGQVIATLGIPNLCQSDNLFDHGAEETILGAIENFVTDLDTYKYVSIIVPDRDDCLSNAAGIGTLGKLTFNSRLHGDIQLGVNFVRSYNKEGFDNVVLSTAIHELGHNLGLNHGNVNSCGTAVFNSGACPGVEYGDGHGIMVTSPNISHYNMIQKEDLGWVNPSEIMTIDSDSLNKDITLIPVSSSSSGIKMIKIRRDDGRYYSVEYRRGIRYDGLKERDFNTLNFGGFLVYLDEEDIGNRPLMIDSEFEDFRSSSELSDNFGSTYYVNFDITDQMHERGLFSLNETFNDTVSDIVVSAQALGSNSAIITVNKGSVEDDGSSDSDSGSGDDSSGANDFDVRFLNPSTLGTDISLDFNKKTKVLLVIPRDSSKASDFTRYSVTRSVSSKRISKVIKNRFDLFRGVTVPIRLASEKVFIKRGMRPDSNGEYTVSVVLKERGRFTNTSPVTLSFKVKSSDI
jgi:hypothetical protein